MAYFFGENILHNYILFPILKVKFSVAQIVETIFLKGTFF